jgi:hypothetical protein
MIRAVCVALAALALSSPVTARQQSTPASLLGHLAGAWVMRGTLQNQQTTHDVEAAWVLNGGYMQLHEVSREKDSKGAPAYEAIIYISVDQKTGEFSCLWLDTTSNAGLTNGVMGRGTAKGNSIPFLFKSGADIFHNTFTYTPSADSWQWQLDDENGGKMTPFARLTLTRK